MAIKVMKCMYCMGTGKKNDDTNTPKKKCPYCLGKGTQEVQV
jgi:hypothetical protein